MNRHITFRITIFLLAMISPPKSFAADTVPVLPAGIITLDGRSAPPLALKNMDGEMVHLEDIKNKWLFIHFWATWCGPCRWEMPLINTIFPQFENSHLKIILVNTAEDEDTVFSFMGIAAPLLNPLLDLDGKVTEVWQPRGLPATFFVDPKGKLRYLALGGRDWKKPEYIQFLQKLP